MHRVPRALGRGFLLRCPACGRGRVYRGLVTMEEGCLECSHVYQRDPGDWTGSAEIAIILGYVAGVASYFALTDYTTLSSGARIAGAIAASGVGIFFFYRHVKGVWVGLLCLWEGPVRVRNPLARDAQEAPPSGDAPDDAGDDPMKRHRFNVRR